MGHGGFEVLIFKHITFDGQTLYISALKATEGGRYITLSRLLIHPNQKPLLLEVFNVRNLLQCAVQSIFFSLLGPAMPQHLTHVIAGLAQ